MKKLLIALAAVVVSVATTFAQGTVSFNTRIPGVLDAPVEIGAVGGPGPGDLWSAELVAIQGGNTVLVPQSKTTFRTVPAGGNAALAKYVNTIGTVEIPNTTVGGSATLIFRAYKTTAGTFDAADQFSRGASPQFTVTGLGGGTVTPANLVGISGFVIPVVPEPSTIALGVLGAAALLLRRRK